MAETKDTSSCASPVGEITPTATSDCDFAPGYARVKAEYLDKSHRPRLAEEYLPKEVTEEFKKASFGEKHSTESTVGSNNEGIPEKRAKFKGRNKKRPIEKKPDASEKFCPGLISGDGCTFGESCRFNHDKDNFLKSKPGDISKECYTFKTFGKCRYGITCRFSGHHTTAELSDVVNEELYNKMKDVKMSHNFLPKETQRKLWKRKYDFSKANRTFKQVQDEHKKAVKKREDARKDAEAKVHETATEEPGITSPALDLSDNDKVPESTVDTSAIVSVAVDTGVNGSGSSSGADHIKESVNGKADVLTAESSQGMSDVDVKLRPEESRKIDFSDKLYLAPLTTVGNLPFRRICKQLGADITCSEMSLATHLLQGQQSEWALLRRHVSEDIFGVQLCGAFPDTMSRCIQLLDETAELDFIDINCGCPIDLIFKKGEGSALMGRAGRFEEIIRSMTRVSNIPVTVKIRTGIYEDKNIAHNLIPKLRDWGASLVTLHGRSREQRYTRLADWEYIDQCSRIASPMPVFGNGDILSYDDYLLRREQTNITGAMIARGALIKPWIFTEIKEERHWDITSSERFSYLQQFVNYAMEHWGSDQQGVATTRRFLLEWLSFLFRYIPVGLLERPPQRINEKPPHYVGRDELETLMASPNCADWIKISEMLLGPVPEGFQFLPKHKANAYT